MFKSKVLSSEMYFSSLLSEMLRPLWIEELETEMAFHSIK